ncbi:flagellin [Siccirubricoccus phaeus]|uniref:flagellin n=1 Tax=Siccirubricoccus phaeus TaxID=2595053 RepID=UPI0011F10C20|nr:flagellin [Siccirubricoccus phaeus]
MDVLTRLDRDTAVLRLRLQQQMRQMSTGFKAETLGDYGTTQPRLFNLKADMTRRDAYAHAIDQALARTQATQTALSRLSEIARKFADDVAMKLDANNTETIPLYADQARQALVEVGQLLNSQANGEYLFAGNDTGNPPVPDAANLDSSAWVTDIVAAVQTLGTGNAAAVNAATLAAVRDDAAGASPFSAYFQAGGAGLAEPQRSVPTADGVAVSYGITVARNGAAVSQGETAGSWVRDLVRGLASIAGLTPAQAADRDTFRDFTTNVRNGLTAASNALADESGALGLTEARLEATKTQHATMTTSLTSQVSGIEEVDLAETLTKLQATQSVLETSYTAIGNLSALSLAKFLA